MIRVSLCLALLALGAGCGGDEPASTPSPTQPAATTTSEQPSPSPRIKPAHCPPDLADCEEATGRIAYVERVDPDGDGDAHFVLLDAGGISGPGITVVDVRRDLRPHPLPGPGDQLSAAGPVFPGSYGQRQIEAVAVSVAD